MTIEQIKKQVTVGDYMTTPCYSNMVGFDHLVGKVIEKSKYVFVVESIVNSNVRMAYSYVDLLCADRNKFHWISEEEAFVRRDQGMNALRVA